MNPYPSWGNLPSRPPRRVFPLADRHALLPRDEGHLPMLFIYGILAALISIYRHRDNIVRLCKGQENNLWRGRKEQL